MNLSKGEKFHEKETKKGKAQAAQRVNGAFARRRNTGSEVVLTSFRIAGGSAC